MITDDQKKELSMKMIEAIFNKKLSQVEMLLCVAEQTTLVLLLAIDDKAARIAFAHGLKKGLDNLIRETES